MTTPQYLSALELANATRLAMNAFCAEMMTLPRREAAALLADLLEREDLGPLAGARIDVLVRSVRRVGPHRADELLADADITHTHIRDNSRGRLRVLAGMLREL